MATVLLHYQINPISKKKTKKVKYPNPTKDQRITKEIQSHYKPRYPPGFCYFIALLPQTHKTTATFCVSALLF